MIPIIAKAKLDAAISMYSTINNLTMSLKDKELCYVRCIHDIVEGLTLYKEAVFSGIVQKNSCIDLCRRGCWVVTELCNTIGIAPVGFKQLAVDLMFWE